MNIKTKLRTLGALSLVGLGSLLTVTIFGLNSMRDAEDAAHRRQSYVIDLVEIKASALSSIMLDPAQQETRDVFRDAEKNISLHGASALKTIKRENIKAELAAILAKWDRYDQQSQAIIKLAELDPKAANEKLLPLYNSEFKPLQADLEKFVAARQQEAGQARQQATHISDKTFWVIVVLTFLVATAIIVAVFNISSSLKSSLAGIQQKLELLKKGDLTERMPSKNKDEM